MSESIEDKFLRQLEAQVETAGYELIVNFATSTIFAISTDGLDAVGNVVTFYFNEDGFTFNQYTSGARFSNLTWGRLGYKPTTATTLSEAFDIVLKAILP